MKHPSTRPLVAIPTAVLVGLFALGLAARAGSVREPAQGSGPGPGRSGGALGDWIQRAQVVPESGYGTVDNYFGRSVSLSGTQAAVGAPSLNEGTGLAHVFDVQGSEWSEVTSLASPLAQSDDEFGSAVSLWYGTLLVGAPGEDAGAGRVHVFDERTGQWAESASLVSPGGTPNGGFGTALSLSRDTAAIGAPGEEAVYVLRNEDDAWSVEAKLTPPTPAVRFGQALAFDGTNLLVGAPSAGRAFVFANTGALWILVDELDPLPSAGTESFGTSVALAAPYAVVGAPRDGGDGEVHVYAYDGFDWQPDALLVGGSPSDETSFGEAVALEGTTLAVGAPGEDELFGRVHVFERLGSGWSQTATLGPEPSNDGSEGNFARYMAIYDGVVLANFGLEDSPVFPRYAGSVTVWTRLSKASPLSR